MQNLLTKLVLLIGKIHSYLGSLNKSLHFNMNDKEMHLVVMAVIGIFIFLFTYLIFKFIKNHFPKISTFIISFIYTFTVMVVITFAIEIGQKITNTGNMEFVDILYGLWGFIIAFLFLLTIIMIIWIIKSIIKKIKSIN